MSTEAIPPITGTLCRIANIGIDCFLKLYNTFNKASSNLGEQDIRIKLTLLLKLHRYRIEKEYRKSRLEERRQLYKDILLRIDESLKIGNETALKFAFECIQSIYGNGEQSDSKKTQNEM